MSRYVSHNDLCLQTFATLCEQTTRAADYPQCDSVLSNVPIYQADTLHRALNDDPKPLMSELHRLFRHGPGVVVIRQGFTDMAVIDQHSAVFEDILDDEARHASGGDHFAQSGANGRIWNALQKAALRSPESFIDYYSNPLIGLVAQAWLGPYYQVTAQVNVVRPGGQAQQPHRDYHLGFQTLEVLQHYPLDVQVMSQYLTLQGAVAHSDMPVETGPTLLLPFSQQYEAGYMAWRNQAFIEYFQARAVQLPLHKGDLLFFNPALMHAAGTNRTADRQRMANLLQISSAFGKPMEALDHDRMMLAVYPYLLGRLEQQTLDATALNAVIASAAQGYAFPTNLDSDPPLQGLAPMTGQQWMHQALSERRPFNEFAEHVEVMRNKRRP
ncbi:phytanoyl-CoA dioxygenase family protein [Pseudomonas sp. 3A(2025)]